MPTYTVVRLIDFQRNAHHFCDKQHLFDGYANKEDMRSDYCGLGSHSCQTVWHQVQFPENQPQNLQGFKKWVELPARTSLWEEFIIFLSVLLMRTYACSSFERHKIYNFNGAFCNGLWIYDRLLNQQLWWKCWEIYANEKWLLTTAIIYWCLLFFWKK